MIKEKSCGVVIFKKNGEKEFLLLHYPSGHWDFPKGHIEEGEKEEETARREIEEETGIKDIKFHSDFRERIEYYYRREKKLFWKEVIFFLAETKTRDVKISHEHQNWQWLPYKKALQRLTFENAKKVLKKAQEFLE